MNTDLRNHVSPHGSLTNRKLSLTSRSSKDKNIGRRPTRSRIGRGWEDHLALYPLVTAVSALLLGLLAGQSAGTGAIAAGCAGALYALNRPLLSLATAVLLGCGALLIQGAAESLFFFVELLLLAAAATMPRQLASLLLHAPRWSWPAAMLLCVAGLFVHHLAAAPVRTIVEIPVALLSAFIGAGVARHLAVMDAKLLAWGEGGMVEVTRDLLLGRITSGMLHDLAQPLNVISMGNANMGYIIGRANMDEQSRSQLQERVERIAHHTEGTAHILSLFRWFGRDGREAGEPLTVRSALECAIATTRSNVRHNGVTVHLQGSGLDHIVPNQYGALQIMAVASLLNAFGSFIDREGNKLQGNVVLHANLSPAHVIITVDCLDHDGEPMPCRPVDQATRWLVEQVALAASSEFRCANRMNETLRFVIRLGRDDI